MKWTDRILIAAAAVLILIYLWLLAEGLNGHW